MVVAVGRSGAKEPGQVDQSTPRMSPFFRNCSCMRKTVERRLWRVAALGHVEVAVEAVADSPDGRSAR